MVWDDVVKNWVPRFGYKKVKAEEEKNWMMHYKVIVISRKLYDLLILKDLREL